MIVSSFVNPDLLQYSKIRKNTSDPWQGDSSKQLRGILLGNIITVRGPSLAIVTYTYQYVLTKCWG
jgi:hypothetical protein